MTGIKKLLIAGASVVAISAGSVAAVSAQGDNSDRHGGKWRDRDNQSRVVNYFKNNFEDLRKGGPLLHEHSALSVALLRAQVDGPAPDLEALKTASDLNSAQISELVKKLYPRMQDDFLPLWKQHITYYTDYLTAAKAGDEAGKQQARQKLDDFAEQIADRFDKASWWLDKNDLKDQLKEHSNNTLSIIDSMVAGDYAQVYVKAHADFEHMTELSFTILLGSAFKR